MLRSNNPHHFLFEKRFIDGNADSMKYSGEGDIGVEFYWIPKEKEDTVLQIVSLIRSNRKTTTMALCYLMAI